MKLGKAQGLGRTERPIVFAVEGGARDTLTLSPDTPASALGIPEAEFTPRVREAVIGLMNDVERLTREVEQMRARLDDASRSADQDMLLPILNRRAFVREITRFISLAERYGTPSSLLYFDLDNFKAVNDAHGHAAGDVVLRHFSDLLASQIRETDVLARLGGDEFGVILSHVTLKQAEKKGASLAQALRDRQPVWQGQVVKLSFSHGAYELRAGENADGAMAEADHAMYAEKRAGR
jgi:diguanylate cyclase (GGDEF)-like protein